MKSAYVELIRNLQAQSNKESPVFRIGGDSTDFSWWNPDGLPNPPNITYSITINDLLSYKQFNEAVGSRFVLGTNFLVANSTAYSTSHVDAIAKYLGWEIVNSIEIGNECDIYELTRIRPTSWSFVNYTHEFNAYLSANLNQSLPAGKAVQGKTNLNFHVLLIQLDQVVKSL